MSLSLRDQLLQAGLIDPKKAKQAARAQHQKKVDRAKRPDAQQADAQAEAARRAAEAKAARDAELNRQLVEKQQQQARRAEVRQLVEQHRVKRLTDSEELYNFVDGKKIRRIPVDKQQRQKLVDGALGIVRCQGRYELVPADIAERIGERDAHALVSLSKAPPPPDDNDPYKDYVVPDDLTW